MCDLFPLPFKLFLHLLMCLLVLNLHRRFHICAQHLKFLIVTLRLTHSVHSPVPPGQHHRQTHARLRFFAVRWSCCRQVDDR
ncbi:hypothetical protein EDD15DRAFT_2281031 [Pisolithus albus]|nr:hypothetical protein EDD15DRAFT_2281031 [Pisolithus albus]